MRQLIAIILEKDERIEPARKRFFPGFENFEPHITVVYPFNVDQIKVEKHITRITKSVAPFEITMHGLQRSAKEYYVYLKMDKGNEDILALHDKLCSGVLQGVDNPMMPTYIPHVSIGIFNSKEEQSKAMLKLAKMDISGRFMVQSVFLLTIDDEDRIVEKEEFKLKK